MPGRRSATRRCLGRWGGEPCWVGLVWVGLGWRGLVWVGMVMKKLCTEVEGLLIEQPSGLAI